MKILVKRTMALGDVLSTTPIITHLRQQYPNAMIVVHTAYANVFERNYAVNEVNTIHEDFDLAIDLDGAHEVRRTLHAVDAYMEAAFGNLGYDAKINRSIIFNYSGHKIDATGKFASIHAAKSWDNRTFPSAWWDEIVFGMNNAGYTVAVLGTNIDYCPPGQILDTRSKLNLATQAAFIAASEVFICGASGLFILAGATNTPVVVPMTINTPETCLPWRWGQLGGGYYPILARVPCIGCSSTAPTGATFVRCESPLKPLELPDYSCINTIKPENVVETALTAIEERKYNQ